MYQNSAPSYPSPYRIEEADGNCVIVAHLGSSPVTAGTQPSHSRRSSFSGSLAGLPPPLFRVAPGTEPHLPLAPQQRQQEEPCLISTPRHNRPFSDTAAATMGTLVHGGSHVAGRTASPLVYAVRRSASSHRIASDAEEAVGSDSGRRSAQPPPATAAAGEAAMPPLSTKSGPSAVTYRAVAGPGTLGPLILVQRRRATESALPASSTALTVAAKEAAGAGMDGVLLTAREAQSHQHELAALRARLQGATEALRAAERGTEAAATAKAQELAEERRQGERRRRVQMQEVMDSLRERCAELTAQLEAARLHGPPPTGAASPVQQAEWGKQLQEVELYWRQRLRTATQHWEGELESQGRDQAALQAQTKELARALEQTQEALRHASSEKRALEAECGRLRETPATMTGGRVLEENTKLRLQVREQERRQEALLTQLASYAEENARLQVEGERQLKAVRREVEKERARSKDLVALYSSQVQSLHQQLNDALSQRGTPGTGLQ